MRTLAGALLSLGVATCNAPTERQPGWDARAEALAGTWTVQCSRHPDYLWPGGGKGDQLVRGSMTLIVNRTIPGVFPLVGTPTNYGMYDLDFSPWGFVPSGNRLPAIVAGMIATDSVALLFDSDRPGFRMTMVGRMAGDTIRGGWLITEGRGAARSGACAMVRATNPTSH